MKREEKSRRISIIVPERMHRQLTVIAKKEGASISALVRKAIQQEIDWLVKEELEQSADKLAPLYASDPELTILTVLDGEDPVENLYGVLSEGPSLTEDLLKERARDLKKEEAMGRKRTGDD